MKFVLRSISYFRPELKLILCLLLMIGCTVGLNLLQAWPLAILVDTVLSHAPQHNPFHRFFLAPFGEDHLTQIIGLALTGMVIKVLQELIWLVRMMLNNRIRLNGTGRLRNELYEKLQHLNISWHRSRSQGDTIYRLSSDTNGPWGILDVLIGAGAASVTLSAMIVIMLSRSVPLTIFALSITPLLIFTNSYFSCSIRDSATQAKRAEANLLVTVQRALSSMGLIQAYSGQRKEAARFNTALTGSIDASMRLAWQENLYPLTVQVIFALGGAIILGYGGYLVYRDQFVTPVQSGVTCGDLIVFMSYLGQLWDPLGWVIGFKTRIQTQSASCERVFEVLDREVSIKDKPAARALPVQPRTLTLSDVSFRYENSDNLLLKGVTTSIEPGAMVAFVGPSGTGKSTLLNLLMRFYDPTGGELLLDQHSLKDLKLSDVRKHMALVSQDCPLLADTIAANLRYGCVDAGSGELIAAAREAGALEFINNLPGGFDTVITEGAQNFSGGQRQRLAIARAIISRAPILVLDEPTSALDPEHEQWIIKTLHHLKRKRTIILVTHKLEAVEECDQIYLLHGGRIAERGTHKQLMARNGLYTRLSSGRSLLTPVAKAG